MKDIVDILVWFIELLRGFFEIFTSDTSFIDDIIANLQGLVKE